MAYRLEGKLLEVCTCNVLCPCWVGADPDNGTCDGTLSWHIEKGEIQGVDVSGLTVAVLCHIPGNILKGNWRAVVFLDDQASSQQEEAILNVFTGKLGGPVADFASLIGEVVGVERVPITFEVEEGKGRLRLGSAVAADLEPFQGATGKSTTLHDSIFTTIPGSPAYVGKAPVYKATSPALGLNIDLQNHNAVQGSFLIEG
ncbi:MAG: DUF1326 domain-containing protein [Deltaproteobacteria bacterium]|nr:DUF1326 domain-containing protein [Deltaproteobacteria bacterium]